MRRMSRIDPTRHLAPARIVVQKIGSVQLTAQAAGVDESRVRRWMMPREKGGTGGLVPTRNQQRLLEWAKQHNRPLRPADFFVVTTSNAEFGMAS